MNASRARLQLWEEIACDGQPDRAFGQPLHHHVEWLRILVGRPLALCQPSAGSGEGTQFNFLVLGVPLEQLERPSREDMRGALSRQICDAVAADVAALRASLEAHLEEIRREGSGSCDSNPVVFLRSYNAIASLRLPSPDRANCWRITDEGLTVVQWGIDHATSRQFLDWNPADFEDLGARLRQRIERHLGPPAGGSPVINMQHAAAGQAQSAANAAETPILDKSGGTS